MNAFLLSSFLRKHFRLLLLFCTLGLVGTGCEIFSPTPVADAFTPRFSWLRTTGDAVMDVDPYSGVIVSVSGSSQVAYNSSGEVLSNNSYTTTRKQTAIDVLADYFPESPTFTDVIDITVGSSLANFLSNRKFWWRTNPYTRYNTAVGGPFDFAKGTAYTNLINPSLARGPGQRTQARETSVWMVGTFTDRFKPHHEAGAISSIFTQTNTSPTFGKADCFVLRGSTLSPDYFAMPVHHQWGGPENDLAYDVASDTAGNATIFLRAGSDFAITSATQSMVKMKVGYNVVRLDTNGLLTTSFPVLLEAKAEITNTKIALAPNNVIYITAKDEQRQQYFLAKVLPTGIEWTRYFDQNVSAGVTSVYLSISSFDLATDSKGNVYLTGSYTDVTDFGNWKILPAPGGTTAFVAKYSPSNVCLGAAALGSGTGITIRLSPQEDALYVAGKGSGPILGTQVPDPNDNLPTRNRQFVSPAFLVKLWLK